MFFLNRLFINKITWRDFLFFMMLAPLVFDFRSNEGSIFVILLGLISLISGILYILYKRNFNAKILLVISIFWIFIITSCLVGVVRGQELYSILAQIMPLVLFSNAALIYSDYFDINNSRSINIVLFLSVISAIWKLIFSIFYYGLDVENMRYQILSGSIILLYSYGIASFLISKKPFGAFVLLLSLGIVFASVTRSFILVFIVSTFIPIFFLNSSKYIISTLFRFSVVSLISVLLLSFILPDFTERWISRLIGLGEEKSGDITSLTRLAEIEGQIHYLKNDIWGLFFGFGIAAPTEWMGEGLATLITLLGPNFNTIGYSYGHNIYVGIIYVGGLLFGIPLISLLLLLPLLFYIKAKKYQKLMSVNEKFFLFFTFFSILGFSVYGLLGGTFGDRSMSIYYGIVFGLMLKFIFINFNKYK